jgi:hypothetical protein
VKVKTNRILLDVDVGASDELPLVIRQSFKDGRYTPSTGIKGVTNNPGAVYSTWSCCKEQNYKY